jgi:hypothetical protein
MKGENIMDNLFFTYVDEDENKDIHDKIPECINKGLCKDIGFGVVMFWERNATELERLTKGILDDKEDFETFINNDNQGDYISFKFAGKTLEFLKGTVCQELIDDQEHYKQVLYDAKNFWEEYDNIAYSVFLPILELGLSEFKAKYGSGRPFDWN